MKSLSWAALGLLLAHAGPAGAAEVTRTLSSFDTDQPVGFELRVGFEREQRKGLITRENKQDVGGLTDIVDAAELRYSEARNTLPIRAAVGLWHDLELHAVLPIVLSSERSWGFPGLGADGKPVTNADNSSITNNCVTAIGTYDCARAGPLFKPPGSAYRSGFGNLQLGAQFAVLSDKRDPSKPTWVVGFEYGLPLADPIDPTLVTTPDKTGSVGDKAHRFTPWMAFSKRAKAVDPYVKIEATLPTQAPRYYSNCDHPERLAFGQNCGQSVWDRATTGMRPQYTGGFTFGSEFWVLDDAERGNSFTIDVRGQATYVSEGRVHNELSDAVGKLLYTEQYARLAGSLTLRARVAKYLSLHAGITYSHDTDHFLTNEQIGRDVAENGTANGQVDLDNHNQEVNPNFDFRYDGVGRRFRLTQVHDVTFQGSAAIVF